jgi:hypothetical protein
MDLLAIFPYYIEIALQKDTVSLSPLTPPRLIVLSDALRHISQSTLFRFSILRTFRLLRVFRPFRYNSTLLLCVSISLVSLLLANARSHELSTIEVMFLSFRRSKDALLALGFFVLMVVIVFSTLLYVRTLSSLYCFGSS